MRLRGEKNNCVLWLSADDTERWAHKPGAWWPCSTLAGRRLVATIDNGDLVDIVFDGGRGEQDCDGQELDAILADFGARENY